MKLQFTQQEVEKIVLDYANRLCADGVFFNKVDLGSYSWREVTVSFVEPAPETTEELA